MPTLVRSLALAVACCLGLLATAWAQPVFAPTQDPVAGSRVFAAKGCATCHAIGAAGGKIGPDLGRIARPRSFYDLASAMWNHLPKMVARMEKLGIARQRLDRQEAGDLIGFLFTLNYFDQPGDAKKGERLFGEKRCVVCHRADSAGASVGPALGHLKQFASPMYVAAALWNHGPQMADVMKARGVERPTFAAAEIRDLTAYLAPAGGRLQDGPLYLLPGRPEVGRLAFAQKNCIQCHQVGGAGGTVGPDLVEKAVRRSPLEFAAAIWNKAPGMTKAMQERGITVPTLRPEEMADIVAYLYSVRYFAEPGSLSRGWALMVQKGCLTCHGVFGERGKSASDLAKSKNVESPAAVLASLWNHTLVTAPAPGGGRSPWPEFKPQEMADLATLLQALVRPTYQPR
jgi:mono/diheme cytochrome c family protein